MKFLSNLDRDLQVSVRNSLRDLWTHTSTALEGNTLTLGDTSFVLNEGLTIGGKSLKDHQEVLGHAKAIEIVYELLAVLVPALVSNFRPVDERILSNSRT